MVILIHEIEKIKQRFPDTKKAKIPLLIRLTEMSRPISTAKSIRELPRKLARSREEVENNYYNQEKESFADYYIKNYKIIETCKNNFNALAKKHLKIKNN